jgi:hypothetical protein
LNLYLYIYYDFVIQFAIYSLEPISLDFNVAA